MSAIRKVSNYLLCIPSGCLTTPGETLEALTFKISTQISLNIVISVLPKTGRNEIMKLIL